MAALILALPSGAAAQARWREEDVLRLARDRSPEALLADATAELAAAGARAAGLYPDPSISWDREALPSEGSSQDIVRLTVPVDLSGRRAAERALARAEGAGQLADAEALRAEAVETALLVFYEGVEAGERAALIASALESLDEAARVLGSREEAGRASGYERVRIELESELARSRLHEAQGDARASALGLARLLGREGEPPALAGSLETRDPAALEALVAASRERPALREARRAEAAASRARSAARRAFIPELSVSAGVNLVDEGQSEVGYVLGAALTLPLSSRGREARSRAEGQRVIAVARRETLERRARAEVETAHARLVSTRGELARFVLATDERLEVLRSSIMTGYREGARTVVELLDAVEAWLDVRLRGLELAAAAKRAEVRLRSAAGELR